MNLRQKTRKYPRNSRVIEFDYSKETGLSKVCHRYSSVKVGSSWCTRVCKHFKGFIGPRLFSIGEYGSYKLECYIGRSYEPEKKNQI